MNDNQSSKSWNNHYLREKSRLSFPDENLVRMLKKNIEDNKIDLENFAVDLGCGSGRHLDLLDKLGFISSIGLDYSLNALKTYQNNLQPLVQCNNKHIPLKNNSAGLVIAWGSLHYNHKEDLPIMLDEIHRILTKGGIFMATLRSQRDTCLRKGTHLGNDIWQTNLTDISGAITSFFSEDEVNHYLKGYRNLKYGLIERTIIGDLKKTISHWAIYSEK